MKATKKVIFTAIIVIIFTLIYFVLGSKQVYTQKALVISTYYPIGVIMGVLVVALLNRYYIKGGGSYTIISSLALIIYLFAFTFAMDFLYRPILSDYYRSGPATLMSLAQYEGQSGNYITIHKQMLKEGVFANSIAEGYSSQNSIMSETYAAPITYHVNGQYIIFDWNTKKLIKKEDQDAIAKAAYDYLVIEKNIPQGQLKAYYFNGCHIDIEADSRYYNVLVYANDGEFAYALNE